MGGFSNPPKEALGQLISKYYCRSDLTCGQRWPTEDSFIVFLSLAAPHSRVYVIEIYGGMVVCDFKWRSVQFRREKSHPAVGRKAS
jgi:hypothetical protein